MSHESAKNKRRTISRSPWAWRNVWGRIWVNTPDDPPPDDISEEAAQQQDPPPKPRPTKVVRGI